MQKLLVSSCLLGNPVRYDGQSQNLLHPGLETLKQQKGSSDSVLK